MNFKYLFFIIFTISHLGCISQSKNDTKHIFYLHGRIIEEQGKNAFSEIYGNYEFYSIISALKVENAIIHGEVRTENVDVIEYAKKISKEIDGLLRQGVFPENITVIGVSKGNNSCKHFRY